MIIPENLPPAPTVFEDFRDLTRLADAYLNEPCSPIQQASRTAEVSNLLEAEGWIYKDKPVILSGLLKKADFPKKRDPTVAGRRYLEEGRVHGVVAGFIVVDLDKDFDDVKDRSPRQDKILDEIFAKAAGRYATAYLVDVRQRGVIGTDFLNRSIQFKSVFGLTSSSHMVLEDYDATNQLFGVDEAHKEEVSRILQTSSARAQQVVNDVMERLRESEDKLKTLARYTGRIRQTVKPENDVEIEAVADYLTYVVEDDLIGSIYEFDGKLPVAYQPTENGGVFIHIDPSTGNQILIEGIGTGLRYQISTDGNHAAYLPDPTLYIQGRLIRGDWIDSNSMLIPLEELTDSIFRKIVPPIQQPAQQDI